MLCWIEIHKPSLVNNYLSFKDILGEGHFAPVLKSNAYGHGIEQVWEILKPESPAWVALNDLEEALWLRQGKGYTGRILVVGPTLREAFEDLSQARIDFVLGNEAQLSALRHLKPAHRQNVNIHIKFDTGMSRQGFLPEQAPRVVAALQDLDIKPVGVCTHFANVEDVLESDYAESQLALLHLAYASFKRAGWSPLLHASSSASSLIFDRARLDMCRVGISLYGFWPSQVTRLSFFESNHKNLLPLEPVLSWPIVGRICMNMMMVDVTDSPQKVEVGDRATLIGRQGEDTITAEMVAQWAGTIQYEIVTCLNQNIPRKVIS